MKLLYILYRSSALVASARLTASRKDSSTHAMDNPVNADLPIFFMCHGLHLLRPKSKENDVELLVIQNLEHCEYVFY